MDITEDVTPVAVEDARVEEFIEISSQEDVVCEDSGCYASRDGLPETSALVSTLLSVALKQWRGAMPEVPPPFYIFHEGKRDCDSTRHCSLSALSRWQLRFQSSDS